MTKHTEQYEAGTVLSITVMRVPVYESNDTPAYRESVKRCTVTGYTNDGRIMLRLTRKNRNGIRPTLVGRLTNCLHADKARYEVLEVAVLESHVSVSEERAIRGGHGRGTGYSNIIVCQAWTDRVSKLLRKAGAEMLAAEQGATETKFVLASKLSASQLQDLVWEMAPSISCFAADVTEASIEIYL